MPHGAGRSTHPPPRSSGFNPTVDDDLRTRRNNKRAAHRDEATLAYIRRILCSRALDSTESAVDSPAHDIAAEPLEELLPPLTSSNAIDVELYALIAVILSNFVQVWYNRITPDQDFVGEIVHIIAHCTRGLEQRIRQTDLESLVLDELPEVLAEHIDAVRTSRTSRIKRFTIDETRTRFLALRPHLALEPVPHNVDASQEQRENELAWCLLLVNRVIPLLLPPEDLENPCLDVLVSEIFSELVFHNGICGKATQPWLIWDGITKLIRSSQAKETEHSINFLESSEFSTAADPPLIQGQHGWIRRRLDWISRWFWLVLQCATIGWTLLRALIITLMQASAIPARANEDRRPKMPEGPALGLEHNRRRADTPHEAIGKRPIIDMCIWGCIARLFSLHQRMPWLSGCLSLLQWISLQGPGQVCRTDSRLDRLMSATVHDRLLNPTWLPLVLQAARSALFPDYTLAPTRTPPTSDEIILIKRGCAEAIVEAIPHAIRTRFFATADESLMKEDVEAELDLLADQHINKHLIISAIDLIAVRLFPEIAGETINFKDVS